MKIVEEISMKCTREQYESIIHLVGKLTQISNDDFVNWKYLNNYRDGTVFMYDKSRDRIIYETFDKDIFLKACGIKVKKDKTKTMFKKTLKLIKALDNKCCYITYVSTDSGYTQNMQGDTVPDGSFTITIMGNKNK
jgi:hypothetical protein